jgi:uncharacterized phage protein (TIGR01671 family)
MKREILFRGKEIKTGKWLFGDLAQEPAMIIPTKIPEELGWEDIFNDFDVDPDTVCQYIGQTDRDGVKIFEGDIVEFDPEDSPFGEENPFYNPENRDVIFWDDHTCKFDTHLVLLDDDNCSRMKVLGNIYDNPELIKPSA